RRFVVADRSFTDIALIPEGVVQPGARRRSNGRESQSPLVACEGSIRLALGPKGGTQIDECVDVIRVERQSVQVRDDGLVELSLRSQRIAEMVVGGRIRGIARERPRYQISRQSMFGQIIGAEDNSEWSIVTHSVDIRAVD